MAKKQIHINGTVKYSGKVFTACDIMVPDEIDEKTAAHLVRIGAATVSKGTIKEEAEPIEGEDNEDITSGNENLDKGGSGDSTNGSGDGDGNDDDGKVDDLAAINGIGEKTEVNLINAGYDTFEKIAAADPKELTKVDGISKKEAPQFIAAAKNIIKED